MKTKNIVMGACLLASFSMQGVSAETLKNKNAGSEIKSTEPAKELTANAEEGWFEKFEGIWKKGLEFKNKDGTFSVKFRVHVKPRYELNILDGKDDDHTFKIAKAELSWEGNAFTKNLKYKFQLVPSASKFEDFIEDAWVDYAFVEGFAMRFGQFKVPYNRQQLNSSGRLQFVDRSLASAEFRFSSIDRVTTTTCTFGNGDVISGVGIDCEGSGVSVTESNKDTPRKFSYDLGLMASGKLFDKKLEYMASVTNGSGFNRLNWNRNLLYSARLVWNVLGEYGYSESDVEYSENPAFNIGLDVGHNVQDITKTEFLQGGFDLGFKYKGFSLQGEYFLRRNDPEGDNNTTTDHGYYVQAGYFVVPKHFEIAARVSQILPEGPDNNKSEFSGGLNYYIFGHDLKLQADYAYLPQEKGDIDDHRLRVQLQAWF